MTKRCDTFMWCSNDLFRYMSDVKSVNYARKSKSPVGWVEIRALCQQTAFVNYINSGKTLLKLLPRPDTCPFILWLHTRLLVGSPLSASLHIPEVALDDQGDDYLLLLPAGDSPGRGRDHRAEGGRGRMEADVGTGKLCGNPTNSAGVNLVMGCSR